MKLTDFGLATGALNPKLIESLKGKVSIDSHDKDLVNNEVEAG